MYLDSCRDLKYSLRERTESLTAGTGLWWLGLGITRDTSGGYRLAVRVTDTRQVPELLRRLAAEAHDELDAFSTGDIRTLGRFTPEELQERHRPLVPGCSVGHTNVTAGTLGGFVRIDGVAHALSNSHVLADSGAANTGDAVVQPGPADDGAAPADIVGTLTDMVPLHTGRANVVDAAIARIREETGYDPAAYPGGRINGTTDDPSPHVAKLGRTTGHTRGRITAFEVDGLRVAFSSGELEFDNQIEIAGETGGFSDGGDSGSLIWDEDERAALGLLFAGSQSGGPNGSGLTYANPIREVLEALGAELVGYGDEHAGARP